MSNELIETRAKVGAVYYIYGVWHDTTTKKQYLIYVPQIFTKEKQYHLSELKARLIESGLHRHPRDFENYDFNDMIDTLLKDERIPKRYRMVKEILPAKKYRLANRLSALRRCLNNNKRRVSDLKRGSNGRFKCEKVIIELEYVLGLEGKCSCHLLRFTSQLLAFLEQTEEEIIRKDWLRFLKEFVCREGIPLDKFCSDWANELLKETLGTGGFFEFQVAKEQEKENKRIYAKEWRKQREAPV